ncbi:MAG TPA: 4-(cytidine 5'-diphospho)-2-C-methyl-D-erythritol kinase [Ilumatobacteraceae bacterium]|nr:4-(cytidine 5'-diphospho)-2-C-methyl-D-erythritol kinase [Ilumatobacteraceae bacterium]
MPTPDPPAPSIRAHAKLTRSLRITGVRPDGYHLIDAEMVSLDLHDLITLTPGVSGLSASGPFSHGIALDDTNLVARAIHLAGLATSVSVHLDKQIPHGGGLGGGSTDAATVLRWCGYGSSASALEHASRLGADIPFCLVGGRARVRGIGELVEPLDHVDRIVTLIIPPLAVSTPAAYRAWDDLGGPVADGPNDLEPAALVVEPELRRWRDRIADCVGTAPVLAGSGATWFVDGARANALGELVDEGARVVVARTVPMDVATGITPGV